jgi:hypothetical protein
MSNDAIKKSWVEPFGWDDSSPEAELMREEYRRRKDMEEYRRAVDRSYYCPLPLPLGWEEDNSFPVYIEEDNSFPVYIEEDNSFPVYIENKRKKTTEKTQEEQKTVVIVIPVLVVPEIDLD